MGLFAFLSPTELPLRIIQVTLGCGISLLVNTGVIMIAAEAVVAVIADKLHKKFGNINFATDCIALAVGLLLSYLFFGTLFEHGIGIVTVISALAVGTVVKTADHITKPLCSQFIGQREAIYENLN